ncbi:hypothetical protein A3A03_02150 [Candidatus Nomurabacteria bacterium RIFCSPLOWO2_01_FULL_40_18]|uniref:Uncharacterized protein n=1 Tax=Candidatus Nomurabacteria bacterium RIFCSPLOWO2_01_FULL_40_18 TaxID=1801773 RepID=A0A1F6XLD2_9BACT|nr:MAG: hypothetical protein A3A03_02150 [Candidatus Nomurabacteria bacterium RIFCSPLOWO2_01_FULL_40_18]
MTSQFKKFLLIITSIIIGCGSFVLLANIVINSGSDNFNAGPAFGILFVPISIIIMFVSYKLLKKVFSSK